MTFEIYTPKVNIAKELAEISKDFTNPKELIRETIANSIDASADKITIRAFKDDSEGEDELVIQIIDNGTGMTRNELEGFFDLGFSNKRGRSDAIGQKGHGSKITYNSRLIKIHTRSIETGKTLQAIVENPKKSLARAFKKGGTPPEIKINYIDESTEKEFSGYSSGTFIELRGYDSDNWSTFSHGALVDYIQWSTAWGNVNAVTGQKSLVPCNLFVQGIGEKSLHEIPFGHPFPMEDYDFRSLRKKDDRRPENYFVRRWILKSIKIDKFPDVEIDIIFSVEGDSAKREANNMLLRPGKKATLAPYPYESARYAVNTRYGIYVCKDYTPIQRVNEHFAERSEWAKWHAFINCQSFHLTANRASVENTPADLLDAIYSTAKRNIDERIINSNEYEEFARRVKIENGRRKADREKKEVHRRLKEYQTKNKFQVSLDGKTLKFTEPRSEQAVVWLAARLSLVWPDIFPLLNVIDIDSHFGYDLLILQKNQLTNTDEPAFVELKHELRDKDDFNHAFDHLAGIICWSSKLTVDDEIIDIQDKKRIFKKSLPTPERKYTKFFLTDPEGGRNIEVIILEFFMKEKLSMEKIHY
jgi:Histidine kinase-, DNA gyrase B-, and HSP90-like ATPase